MKYLPKLTTRDLLWMVIVIALAFAWISDRLRLERDIKDANRQAMADLSAIQGLRQTIDDLVMGRVKPETLRKSREEASKRLP